MEPLQVAVALLPTFLMQWHEAWAPSCVRSLCVPGPASVPQWRQVHR